MAILSNEDEAMSTKKIHIIATAILLSLSAPVAFAAGDDHSKMDHSGHGAHGPAVGYSRSTSKGKLKSLSTMPPSGRAREAGSDGRYAMEATSVETPLEVKCAQATRGIIMLDNATWKRCGGKPKGASMGVDKKADGQHQHKHH
jgi:hypothetical protein